MPVSATHFRRLTELSQSPNARLALTSDKKGISAHRTGLIQWIKGRLNTAENREVSKLFLASIQSTHGQDIAHQMANQFGLYKTIRSGRPLHAREVEAVLDSADEAKARIRDSNERALNGYFGQANKTGQSAFQSRFQMLARQYLSADADFEAIENLCQLGKLSDEVRDTVLEIGREGQVSVPLEKIEAFADAAIRNAFLNGPYRQQLEAKLDLSDPQSLGSQSLNQALDAGSLPGSVKGAPLSDAMRSQLQTELSNEIGLRLTATMNGLSGGNPGAKTLDQVFSDASIRDMAGHIVDKHIDWAAKTQDPQQEGRPPINDKFSAELKRGVLSSAFPEAAVAPLIQSHHAISALDQVLAAGATQREQSAQLKEPLKTLYEGFVQATAEKGNSGVSREQQFAQLWGTLLQGKSPEALKSLAEKMASSNQKGMSDLLQATKYLSAAFMETEQPAAPRFSEENTARARDYHLMLTTLAQTLEKKTGTNLHTLLNQDMPESYESIFSHSLDTLVRNLGIETPRVTGLNRTETDIPLPDASLRALEENVESLQTLSPREKIDPRGVLNQMVIDIGRASYYVGANKWENDESQMDIETLRDRVVSDLEDLCRDSKTNEVNKELLLGISKYASQRAQAGMVSLLGYSPQEDVTVISSAPNFAACKKIYNVQRTPDGGATIHFSMRGNTAMATVLDHETMNVQMQELDAEKSNIEMVLEVKLNSRGEDPKMTEHKFGYSLYPTEENRFL